MPDTRQQLEKQFDKLLAALNPEQRRAVDQIEGPALVIAGPGTGKTHLVATRIAHILVQTDTPAQSILCLTYSEAGATAMRRRLAQIVGSDAQKMSVSTYHSFCSRVMMEHPELFGRGREMELLGELERSQWMDELMDGLPPSHLFMRRYKGLSNVKKRLAHLFSAMKSEKWEEQWMLTQIAAYQEEMLTSDDFRYKRASGNNQKGDLKQGLYDDWTEKLEALKAGIALNSKWQRLLTERHRYEFDDMVVWVIDALDKHKSLKLQLQERYLYLVVDEYQDTNAAQNQLIKHLTDYWEQPNVFIVGDDDQSIFEFQGARLRNLVEYHEQYADVAEVVVLEQNYRSGQPILDAARRLIDHNTIRALPKLGLGDTKNLRAVQTWTDEPQILAFEDEMSEMLWVADTIEEKLAAGATPNEVAVIYRTNKEGERIGTLLRERGIAFSVKKDVSILDLSLVRQLNELMTWCVEELNAPLEGDAQLFYLLHHPYWALKPLDLALLLAKRRAQDQPQPLRVVLNNPDFVRSAGVAQPDEVLRVMQTLEQLIAHAATMPLLRYWTEVLNATATLRWCLEQVEAVYWTQVVHTFTAFLEAEVKRVPQMSVQQLPTLLRNMQDLNVKVPLVQTAQATQGVQLLTAHSVKGLEYETVFVYGCTHGTWQDQNSSNRNKFTLPPNITLSGEEDALEAQRRLFYVAMTRAKRHLYLTYAKRNAKLNDQLPAQFLAETGVEVSEPILLPDQIAAAQMVVMSDVQPVIADIPRGDLVAAFLDTYRLSLSGLNQYLKCPLAFFYEKILKLPDVASDAARFGSHMHAALEQYFIKRNAAKEALTVDLKVLKMIFRSEMQAHQHRFSSAADYRNKLEYGTTCLELYYEKHAATWPAQTRLETRIDNVTIGDVPVAGVIDRIDLLDQERLHIVDYKTGKYDKKKFDAPSEKAPHGGDFYRQGLFYKLLADASPYVQGQVTSVAFSFLEPDKDKKYQHVSIDLDPGAQGWMRELIKTTWAGILQNDFSTGCGEKTCTYCNLHRTGAFEADRLEDVYALDDEK